MSNVKNITRLAVIPVMILTLMFSMTGCKKKNKLTTYRGNLNETLQEMSTVLGDFQTSINTLNVAIENEDQTSYDAALATLQTASQTLINGYHALANQSAPEEYQEQQALLKQYADDVELMLSNEVRLYTLAGEAIGGYLTDDSSEQIGRLRTEIEALSASAQAFDTVLNEILGVEQTWSAPEETTEESTVEESATEESTVEESAVEETTGEETESSESEGSGDN